MSIENEIKKLTGVIDDLVGAISAAGKVSVVDVERNVEQLANCMATSSKPSVKSKVKKKPKTEKPGPDDNSPYASNIKDALLNVQNFLGRDTAIEIINRYSMVENKFSGIPESAYLKVLADCEAAIEKHTV